MTLQKKKHATRLFLFYKKEKRKNAITESVSRFMWVSEGNRLFGKNVLIYSKSLEISMKCRGGFIFEGLIYEGWQIGSGLGSYGV